MRNKFVYSCRIKTYASGFYKLLESIFCLLLGMVTFSLPKVADMYWQGSSQLARGQVNIADEAKLRSLIRSTFEALVVQHGFGHCCGAELDPFCWSILASDVAVFGASHQLAEHISLMQWFCWDLKSRSWSDGQQTTKQWPWLFSGASLLWEVLWSFFSVQPELVTGGCCIKSTFYHTSQSSWEMVQRCCTE